MDIPKIVVGVHRQLGRQGDAHALGPRVCLLREVLLGLGFALRRVLGLGLFLRPSLGLARVLLGSLGRVLLRPVLDFFGLACLGGAGLVTVRVRRLWRLALCGLGVGGVLRRLEVVGSDVLVGLRLRLCVACFLRVVCAGVLFSLRLARLLSGVRLRLRVCVARFLRIVCAGVRFRVRVARGLLRRLRLDVRLGLSFGGLGRRVRGVLAERPHQVV